MIEYESANWLGILTSSRGSVLPKLLGRMAIAGGVGIAAVAIERATEFSLPPVAHGLIGVALGLLLVFRTNASYDRFWEGRKLVGGLVNTSRDLVRQAATELGDGDDARDVRRLVLAFYALTVQRLRKEDHLAAVGAWLTEAEREQLMDVVHRAPVTATWLSSVLARARAADAITELALHRMDANVSALITLLGGCERIRFTQVPFAYAHHIKVFLAVFCFTAPFAMVDGMGLWTPVAAVILSLALFGIDEIGVEIEDPFGRDPNDLPLDALADGLDVATDEILRVAPPVGDARDASVAP